MDDQTNDTPAVESEQLSTEKAAPETTEGAETEKVSGAEAPTPKTYTEEEWKTEQETWTKRYSGLDSKLTETKRQSEAKATELEDQIQQSLAQIEEAKTQAFIRSVEESGGDVDVARRVATREQQVAGKERQLKSLETKLQRLEGELNEAGKGKKAHDLIKEHELEESDLETLLKLKTPEEMENKALKLHLEKMKVGERPPTKVDESVGSTKGADLSKMTDAQALGQAMEDVERRRS